MQNENDLINDAFGDDLRTATTEVLEEQGFGNVRVNDVQPEIDSDRYVVGLTERTGPNTSKYHAFRIDSAEALIAVHGGHITVESLKPLVLREVLRLFPAEVAV